MRQDRAAPMRCIGEPRAGSASGRALFRGWSDFGSPLSPPSPRMPGPFSSPNAMDCSRSRLRTSILRRPWHRLASSSASDVSASSSLLDFWWLILIAWTAALTVPQLAMTIGLEQVPLGTIAGIEWHFDEMFHAAPAMTRSLGYDDPGYTLVLDVSSLACRSGSGHCPSLRTCASFSSAICCSCRSSFWPASCGGATQLRPRP